MAPKLNPALGPTTHLRLLMLRQGYQPVPVMGKRPLLPDWRAAAARADEAELQRWTTTFSYPNAKGGQSTYRGDQHSNTGLLCGQLVGVDIDVLDAPLAERLEGLAREMLGDTPLLRIGRAPKRLLAYRTATPMAKAETVEGLKLPNGSPAQIEILGQGQQFVAYGIHPDTQQDYEWPGQGPDTVALADLPAVTEAGVAAFLAAADGMMRAAGCEGPARPEKPPATPAAAPTRSLARPSASTAPRQGVGGSEFFREVNRRALADIAPWFGDLFPRAKHHPGTGAWRVTSADLNRPLEEDLSMHPVEGGRDWGTGKSCSPIDVVLEWGGAPTPQEAAFWLCGKLRISPAACGWKEPRAKPRKAKPGTGPIEDAEEIELTEHAVAEEFARRHAEVLRYCHHTGAWFFWTDTHWERNETKLAFTWARRLVAELNTSAEFKTKAITGKAAFAGAVERFAQADERLAVTSTAWDQNPWLLGTPGGTVDLRTGILRPANSAECITRVTAVAPAATAACPVWLRFLNEATAGDQALIRFLQLWSGYCLTGDTREHALLFIYGPGGNGKGVFLNTIAGVMGAYAVTASMETFTASPGDRHPTDLAMLQGARLVSASETEEGRSWAESRIKQMTGGDPITARFMRQDFFTYQPQFKLTIVGNHKPGLKSVDEAARRRFNIVPFTHEPMTKDAELPERLRAEWSGILRWMIEGCRAWSEGGLQRPSVVYEATAEYFEAQDLFGRWMAERCIRDPHLSSKPGTLLEDYRTWAITNGEVPPTASQFRSALEKVRGIRLTKYAGTRLAMGIGIKPEPGWGAQ